MDKTLKELQKILKATHINLQFVKNQQKLLEKEDKENKETFWNHLHTIVVAPESYLNNHYFLSTIANFRTLNESIFYKNTQDTDTIYLKTYVLDVLKFGVENGRVFITLPKNNFNEKAFIDFLKVINVSLSKTRETTDALIVFSKVIKFVRGDKNKYKCYQLIFDVESTGMISW